MSNSSIKIIINGKKEIEIVNEIFRIIDRIITLIGKIN